MVQRARFGLLSPCPRKSRSAPSSEKERQLCRMSSTNPGQGRGGGISLGEGCGYREGKKIRGIIIALFNNFSSSSYYALPI